MPDHELSNPTQSESAANPVEDSSATPMPIEVKIVRNPITPMRSTFEYDTILFSGGDVYRLDKDMEALGKRGFRLAFIERLDRGTSLLLLFEKWCPITEEANDDE